MRRGSDVRRRVADRKRSDEFLKWNALACFMFTARDFYTVAKTAYLPGSEGEEKCDERTRVAQRQGEIILRRGAMEADYDR